MIRALPMSALELTEEWFESEQVRAAIGAVAVHGVDARADVGGHRLHADAQLAQSRRPGPSARRRRRRPHRRCARRCAEGARRRSCALSADVKTRARRRQPRARRAIGGRRGDRRAAGRSRPPTRATRLLDLVGAPELPPEFVWHTQSIKMRGSVAKVHLLTDGNHGLPKGTLVVAPSIRYLERAYDAAKYGEMSTAALSRNHDGRPRRLAAFPVRAVRLARQRLGAGARGAGTHAPSTPPRTHSRSSRRRSAKSDR